MPETIEITEGTLRRFRKGELSSETAGAIYRSGHVELRPTPFDQEYAFEMSSKDEVGHIPIGKDLVIRIAPKTPILNLFRMLEVAYDLKSFKLLQGTVSIETLEDIFERLALILANRVLSRVRRGIYRDYVTEREDLSCIRGRLQVRETGRRLMYGSAKVHCEYQEHTANLEDNQILLWALWVLSRTLLARDDVRVRIRAAYRVLSHGVSLFPFPSVVCINRRYHRLNDDYQALHGICRLVLEHTGPGQVEGKHTMIPFVVNMPQLFERFIALWLQDNVAEEYQVRIQHIAALEATTRLSFKIDLVLRDVHTGKPIAVMDTKYKLGEAPLESDIQQVVAYAVEMGVQHAFLVYPSAIGGNFRAKVGDIVVEGLRFDLNADPDLEGHRFREALLERVAA